MTSTKLAKIVAQFASSIASGAAYDLDGVSRSASVSVHTSGSTVRVMVEMGIDIAGTVGNVRIYDSDSVLLDESSMSFIKPLGKKFYISFVYEITERVV